MANLPIEKIPQALTKSPLMASYQAPSSRAASTWGCSWGLTTEYTVTNMKYRGFLWFLKLTMVFFFANPFALMWSLESLRNHGGCRGCPWMGLINWMSIPSPTDVLRLCLVLVQWRHCEKKLGNFREVGFPNGSALDFKWIWKKTCSMAFRLDSYSVQYLNDLQVLNLERQFWKPSDRKQDQQLRTPTFPQRLLIDPHTGINSLGNLR